MGNVLLWHLDGRLPNLALMRLAAHHRVLGDTVELRRGPPSRLLWDRPTRVYGSLLFTRSRPLGERLRALYPDAILGGTGWDATHTMSQVGIPEMGPLDYTLYPGYPHSLGYTQLCVGHIFSFRRCGLCMQLGSHDAIHLGKVH